MFRTKKDVERHVADVLSKIDSENEKHLRGYTFARLFFQVKDYESAKKYLIGFLSVRDHHAASHKLMAQIYEATNNPENALQSYKRSLEIDSHQSDIVLKICDLYCQLPVDHETARYWADRAEQLYPHHDTVFKLRECLVSAEGEPDRQELENLIASDLAAQPKNVDRRITLLRLYLDTERVKEAYDHATMIESKRLFPYSIDWYYLLGDIFEAYQEEYEEELDSQFYINYLTALDHLIYLTLAEPHAFIMENGKKSSSLNDAAAVLLTFDQLLKKAAQKDTREGSWLYFINHMKGQLYFHMTSLLMKRAKNDQGNRKEAFRFSAGLAVVCYTFKPINILHEVWFSQLEDNQKAFTNFFQQGSLRTSFIGHVLLSLCKDDKSSWVQRIKTEVCIPQVKERIYSRIFSSLFKKEKLPASYFISDSTFEQSSLELPSEVALKEYDKHAYKLCPNSLHHLVWLELHRENARISSCDTIQEIFRDLQYSNSNLSKGSCESLCILDLESYLYATVYQSKFIIEKKNSIQNARNGSLLSYPPDITDALCTTVQATWWKSAYGLYSNSIKEKLGEHRRNLQQGLEVIRGVGCHGMEVQLVIHLAHIFSMKADTLDKNSEKDTDKNKKKLTLQHVNALYLRASHYWNIALGMLEKLASGKTLSVPKDPMFIHSGKALSKSDINGYQEEGKLFLAVRLMDSEKLNEAAEILSKLSSPYGSYYLALTLKKLAAQEQEFSSPRTALLNKAKTSLLETMDRIKDDRTHPLNKELFIELEDVENDLAIAFSIANENSCEDADEIDSYDDASVQNLSYSVNDNQSIVQSTPKLPSKFVTPRRTVKGASHVSPQKHFEPSPERLDAQIRALTLNQDTFMKSFFQQQQSLLEMNKSVVEVVQQTKDVLEQLQKQLKELNLANSQKERHPVKTVPKKSMYLKGQGDEEEDFYEHSNILEFYEDGAEDYRASGYNFDRSSRMAHDGSAASALNYVVPHTLPPPGPPPAVNHHFNYQYAPHGLVPTPPPAVPGRPTYYPPPGQGLPFNEGQQLPQFHFHVASAVGKPPPPPTLNTSLPQVVSGLPPPPVSVPPMSVALPPSAVPPLTAPPNPWSKPVTVPHAFQIPLPTSSVIVSTTVTPVTASSVQPVATASQSQLKDLLQTPPVTRTITFGLSPTSTTPTAINTPPSLFAGLNKTPEIPGEHTRFDSENVTSPDIDGHDLEKEVMGDFKPLIPLPAEIVVETGEENEIVLFEDRAKLYRFIDQEWKERGIGVVKILHHEGSKRVRLLMRRDQVLKVCANHYITSNMEIHPLKNSDKAWTWVASDFADEELRPEHFCIRFKTPEIAAVFKTAFEKAINISKETEAMKAASPKISTAVTTTSLSSKPFDAKFLAKPGSWTCPTCYVSNSGDKLLCAACETKKPGSQTSVATVTPVVATTSATTSPLSAKGFGAKFLPKPGSWTCPTCYVSNPGDKLLCAACETKKPGSQTSTITSASPTVTTMSVTSEFGGKTFQTTANSGGFKFGFPTSSSSNVFSTVAATTANSAKNVFGGFTFTTNPVIQEAEAPEVKDREILLVSTKAKNGPQVTKVNPPVTSPFLGFSFKTPVTTVASSTQSSTTTSSSPFSGFSFKPSPVSFTTSASQSQPTVISTTVTAANVSISTIQTSMQNVSPAFVFSKDPNKEVTPANETKSSASDSDVTGSAFTNASSDTSKSAGEFVFGMKPIAQPTTFTFGLSGLSTKPNETFSTTGNAHSVFDTTTGFKAPFSITSNAPVFGGATQKVSDKPTETSSNASIFGGVPTKTDSQISSVFGESQKTETSQNASIFGGIAQKLEAKTNLSSIFGEVVKTESADSIFNKSASSTENKPLFGGLTEKSETTKSAPIPFGTIQKPETSIPAASTITNTSQAVFNFGSSSEAKGDTGPVEFRFGSPQKYEFNFSGVRPRSPTKTPKSPAMPSDAEEDEENESFDADNIYFQPVIPLPPKVDVKTGEENEKTLFCKRAKLFRFCSGEWKERGIGDFKILYDETSKKVRFLMRRDQVLKVCLNHYLTKDIAFEKRGDKTLSWAATDFSENEPSPELFALRFKTSEFADECLAAIETALNPTDKTSNASVSKLAASFSFKTDSVPKTESLFTPGSLSSRFGTSGPSVFNAQPSTETSSPSSAVSFSFKDQFSSSTFFNISSSEDADVAENKRYVFGTGLGKKAIEATVDDDSVVELVYEAVPSPDDVALARKLQLPDTFFLYKNKPPCPGCTGCEDFIPPSKGSTVQISEKNSSSTVTSDNTPSTNVSVVNTSSTVTPALQNTLAPSADQQASDNSMFKQTGLSFADLASNSGFGGLSTAASTQKKAFEGAGTPLFANLNNSAEGEGDEDTVAQEPDIHFEPVIPLPELIAVKTGEEDETPIFVNRAKLFRYDTAKKEWKERGVGDFKILKHNEKLRFRMILRRDQVHKIACNHCIAENMEMSPLATSETALCWNALDYSDGQPEASQFAVRFKNKVILEEFRNKFNQCKEALRKGEPESSGVQNVTPSTVQIVGPPVEQSVSHGTMQGSVKSGSPEKEVPVHENVTDYQNEHESSGSETNEDDEDSETDSIFEKRVSFEISEGNDDNFQPAGMGLLKVMYDDTVYGYHVYMIADNNNACLCDHIIAIQTSLRTEKKRATWTALDFSVDPPRRRRFRASFSSTDAVKEFHSVFEDGKDAALQSEIFEKTDDFYTPGQQT